MTPARVRPTDADVWPVLRDTLSEMRLLGAHFLREYRLTVGQAMTLHRIRDSRGLRLSALAEGLGISRPAASALVSSLESQGWAKRDRTPGDRRGVVVRLTPRADRLLHRFDREFESIVRSATGPLPRELREPTVRTLNALRNEMERRRGGAHVAREKVP